MENTEGPLLALALAVTPRHAADRTDLRVARVCPSAPGGSIMARGKPISRRQKLVIAQQFLSGIPVAKIAQSLHLTEQAIYRLRREDAAYRQIERTLVEEVVSRSLVALSLSAGRAVTTLNWVLTLDAGMSLDEHGTPRPPLNPKLVEQKRLAANDVLHHLRELGRLDMDPVTDEAIEHALDTLLGDVSPPFAYETEALRTLSEAELDADAPEWSLRRPANDRGGR